MLKNIRHKSQEVTTAQGKNPEAESVVTNKSDLPTGTKVRLEGTARRGNPRRARRNSSSDVSRWQPRGSAS